MKNMYNQDRLEFKVGGGVLIFFGLPFLLAGLAVIASVFIPAEVRGGDPIPWFFGIPFGSIFAGVGALIVFGRNKIVIDKINSTLVETYSVIFEFKRKEYDLSEFNAITITEEVRRSKNSTYVVFPVSLTGKTGLSVVINTERLHEKARKASEKLSKFLDLDVKDTITKVVRKAGTMDQSVKEKIINSGEEVVIGEEPAGMKSECYMVDDSFVVEIPPIGFKFLSLLNLIPVAFIVFILRTFLKNMEFSKADLPIPMLVFFAVFSLIIISPIYKNIIKPIICKYKLELNQDELRFTIKAIRTKTIVLKCNEIEELLISKGGKGISVITDNEKILIGSYLQLEELKYLLAIMKQIMIS
jgi:hypothetical protein